MKNDYSSNLIALTSGPTINLVRMLISSNSKLIELLTLSKPNRDLLKSSSERSVKVYIHGVTS